MTIFSILVDPGGCAWIATTSGLRFGQPNAWQVATNRLPLQPTALAGIADGSARWQLLVAGPPGGIVIDAAGAGWLPAWVDEVESSITCVLVSPRFAHDRVLLAGTESAGVLRSTDGGRNWRLSSAGLDDLAVLALATAPSWEQRELVLAGTTCGLYRSPNAGRAWAACGLDQQVVQAIAFAGSAIFAGTEQSGLYRSTDHGARWLRCSVPTPAPVNALWSDSSADSIVLAATADGELLRSTDRGDSWELAHTHDAAVLAIAGDGTQLYAGCADDVLLISHDRGQSWRCDPSFAAAAG
jgi:photosystem II stability/assembly factor-like uncharacterized protein